MSKKFDEEFKAYAVKDIPDLWDRIEPALSEKVPIKQEEPEAVKKEQPAPVKRKKKFLYYLPIVIPSVCAAAIILLLLPTLLLPTLFKKSDMWPVKSGDSGVPQTAESAEMITYAPDECAEEAIDGAYDNGIFYEDAAENKNMTAATQGASVAAGGEADWNNGIKQETEVIRVAVDILNVREENGVKICLIRLNENLPEGFPVKGKAGDVLEAIPNESGNSLPAVKENCSIRLEYREDEEIPLLLTCMEE